MLKNEARIRSAERKAPAAPRAATIRETASMAADLLRSASWHAEKLFRRRANFVTVLWLSETTDGTRTLFETGADNAPDAASDKEVLAALAAETRADFIDSGVVRFAVAYLCDRVNKIDPSLRKQGVLIELHEPNGGTRWFREILDRRRPLLAAPEACAEPLSDSPFAHVLANTR